MEKTQTGSLDLEKIMPKAVGSTQNVEKSQQELLAGKTIHMQKKEGTKGGKEHSSSTGQKDFPILQLSGY